MSEIIEIHLTDAQLRKIEKGLTFQSTASSLRKEANVKVQLPRKDALRLRRNVKNNKGFRFSPEKTEVLTMEGGRINFRSIGRKIKRGVKKATKYVTSKKGLAGDLVDYAIPATTGALLGTVGSLAGPVAGVSASALGSKLGSMASKKINKVAGTALPFGLNKKSTQKMMANKAIDLGAKILDKKTNLSDSKIAKIKSASKSLVNSNPNKAIALAMQEVENHTGAKSGSGIVKFKKGSQEAKDHMAKLRAMRKPKSGGNVSDSVNEVAGKIEKAGKKALSRAKSQTKAYLKENGKSLLNTAVNAGAASLAVSNPELTPAILYGTHKLNKAVNKKINGLGVSSTQPLGGGNSTRIVLSDPTVVSNREGKITKGGSFLPY